MKRELLTVVLVAFVTFSTVALSQAGVSSVLSVELPFAFAVGDTVLPAGHYTVEISKINSAAATGSLLTLHDKDGKRVTAIRALPDAKGKLRSGSWLTFRKYDNSYFLARVESYGLGCEVARSGAEREMTANRSHGGTSVSVAAQ